MLNLVDVIVRHQIYLEGLKAGQFATYQQTSRLIERDVKSRLSNLDFESMDGLTKTQLRRLLADLRDVLTGHYSRYTESLIEFLRAFMEEDCDLVKAMYEPFTPKPVRAPDDDKRWAAIINNPMPSSGALMRPWVQALATQGAGSVLLRVNQAYANGEKVDNLRRALVGTSAANFRDGLLTRTDNTARSVISTALQHVAANNQAQIAALIWPMYVWVSVLDNRTTHICRDRNGNKYRYNSGPIPPAHPNCRSSIVPDNPDMPIDFDLTFAKWLQSQPYDLRADMFDVADPTQFTSSPPLSLAQFKAKRHRILQDA